MKGFQVKQLETKEEIMKACKLLYTVYIEEQEWRFSNTNPSALKIETTINGSKILTDNYTEMAIWFGVFFNEKLIGSMRGLERNSLPFCLLELQQYQRDNIELNNLLSKENHPNLVEINRLVIEKKYRSTGYAILMLFRYVFSFALSYSTSIVGTSSIPSAMRFLDKIGFPKIKPTFRYEAHDEKPVVVYLANYKTDEVKNVLKNIDEKLCTLKQRRQKIDSNPPFFYENKVFELAKLSKSQ